MNVTPLIDVLLVLLIIVRPQGFLPSAQRERELEEKEEDPSLVAAAPGPAP